MNAAAVAVEFRAVSKAFGACMSNRDLSFSIASGSIHAIVGENGAGKSTAMNLLYGLFPRDSGEIYVEGQERRFSSPADAMAAGIGMIHQHFSLSNTETVLDNIILGVEPTHKIFQFLPHALRPIDRASARTKLRNLANEYGLEVELDIPVERLSVGVKQRVEILKLLFKDARILILDEPTAVLTPQEITSFFENLRRLRASGKTILIITHKLEEVLALSDAVTVFKNGSVVGRVATSDTNAEQLAEMMVGRQVRLSSNPRKSSADDVSTPCLRVAGVSLQKNGIARLKNLSFDVRPGEIVGLAGVQGNGQSEIEELLIDPRSYFFPRNDFHGSRSASGELRYLGKSLNAAQTSELYDHGLAFVTEDRLKDGLIAQATLGENFLLGLQHSPEFSNRQRISWKQVNARCSRAIGDFSIKAQDPSDLASQLSGGNQQKLIFAREMSKKPKFLLAAQPTRGVDIGAIEFIHDKLRELQGQGAAILLISSELSEILSLSNRILVLHRGEIVNSFVNDARRSRDSLENEIGLAMGGMRA